MKFNQILELIEKRYSLYFNEYNINDLDIFLQGCHVALYLDDNENNSPSVFYKFCEWLLEYYSIPNYIPEESSSYEKILLFYNGSHEKAVKTFFKLYKQWHKEEFGEDAW